MYEHNNSKIMLSSFVFDPLSDKQILHKRQTKGHREGIMIIQFKESFALEERYHIQNNYGLKLTDYIPNLAYLEGVSAEQLRKLSKDPLSRAETPYLPAFKIAPGLGKKFFKTDERKKMKEL